MAAFIARPPRFLCAVFHLAVLGSVGGGLASSAHEWLLQRLGAVTAQRGIAAVALARCVIRPGHIFNLHSDNLKKVDFFYCIVYYIV